MPPWQGGGDMIHSVTFEKTTYNVLPYKFEAGTPHIAGAVGLGAAIDYFQSINPVGAFAHEDALLRHATARLREIPGVRIVGNARHKSAAISFVVDAPPLSALDVAAKLNLEGVAVRSGHHCCQPLMERFGIPGTARASFALYNTAEEVDRFADALRDVVAGAAGRPKYSTDHLPIAYPAAAADGPQAAADELADVLDFLDDWPQRYQYILELGEELPPLPDEYRTEANRVHGCQSTVYLTARKRPGSADVVEFLADSDADLVRGLIGLLERLFCGQRGADILAFDVEGFFARVGLDQHLTLGRRNGLASMVQRVRSFAAKLAGGGAK
jgi:cysteine desulfurase/selenocysteine lyase